MASKIGNAKEIEVYCSELGRYAYEVRRTDRTDYGKLAAKPGSPHQPVGEVVDAAAAFAAWMKVLSLYGDWKEARDAARILQLKARGEPISAEQVKACRLYARPLSRRVKELDDALIAAAEDHGDLGVGQDIETIAIKLSDLQNFLLFDDELRKLIERSRPDEPLPEHMRKALERDGRSVEDAVKGMRRVHSAIERTSHTLHQGRLMVNATNMYEVIVVGAFLAAQHDKLHVRVCSRCLTLFVAKHPNAKTCSPRCRQRKRA